MSAQLQFPLFTERHIARRTDPETSHKAAREHKASGAWAQQQAAVFAWVRQYPNHTSQELGEICAKAKGPDDKGGSLDSYDFARRCAELAATEDYKKRPVTPLLKRNGTKVCSVTGNSATAWVPADWQAP